MKKEYLSPELEIIKMNFARMMEESPAQQNVSDPEGYAHDDQEIEM